jgi:hypothetical protein
MDDTLQLLPQLRQWDISLQSIWNNGINQLWNYSFREEHFGTLKKRPLLTMDKGPAAKFPRSESQTVHKVQKPIFSKFAVKPGKSFSFEFNACLRETGKRSPIFEINGKQHHLCFATLCNFRGEAICRNTNCTTKSNNNPRLHIDLADKHWQDKPESFWKPITDIMILPVFQNRFTLSPEFQQQCPSFSG